MSHAAALLTLTDREHRVRSAARRLLYTELGDARRAVNIARGYATQPGDPEFWREVVQWIEANHNEKGVGE